MHVEGASETSERCPGSWRSWKHRRRTPACWRGLGTEDRSEARTARPQISIGASRENPREIPARPVPAASMQAVVAGLSDVSVSVQARQEVRWTGPPLRRPASLACRKPAMRRPRGFFAWPVAAHDDRDLSFQDCPSRFSERRQIDFAERDVHDAVGVLRLALELEL